MVSVEKKKCVLVVDDERGILAFIRIKLAMAGYEVLTAAGGKEALQLARSAEPDVVVLDIVMVPMNGFEVLEELRTFSRAPVIVFTGQSGIADRALKLGANDHIAKPFHPDELVARIKRLLEAPAQDEARPPDSGLV